MEIKIILFILMVIIFTTNALFLLIKYRAESLSSEWYYMENNWKYLFPIITMIYSTLAIIVGVQYSEWVLMAGIPLYYVAAAPEYKEDGSKSITHFFGAGMAIIGSIITAIHLGFWWLSLLACFISVITWLILPQKHKITFFAECYFFYAYAYMIGVLIL